jgi:hypothetical protein
MLRFSKIHSPNNHAALQWEGFGRFCQTFTLCLIILLVISVPAKAQDKEIPKPGSDTDTLTKKPFDFAQNHFYWGFRYLPVDNDFMHTFLDNDKIPTLDFQPLMMSLGFSLYRDWWYADANFSFILSEEQTLDSLRSRLDQNSLALRFGYNLVNRRPWLISPYLGLWRVTYLHLTVPEVQNIDLDTYLSTGELDFRISQWAATLGIQITLLTRKGWSVGISGAYLLHLHNRPVIRGEENRISHSKDSPLGRFSLGLTLSSFQEPRKK